MKNPEKTTGSMYDSRYRRKLNMLEPGMAMLKWIGLLGVAGLRSFRRIADSAGSGRASGSRAQ